MSTKNEPITIYGAGMSGLVCAINLARDGYKVIVHDKEGGFGGDPLYNPSTHTTPIDVKAVSDYIGIDVSAAFSPLSACPFYFHDTRAYAPHSGLYCVERGNRSTSLDTILYDIAKELGIQFEFNSVLKKDEISKLPKNTIIACGLTESVYEMMNIPYISWNGYISRGEIGFSNYAWIWMDECISEYGYMSAANNYYFDLLFSVNPVTEEHLKKYIDFMRRAEGVEHDNWQYAHGAVPVAAPENPHLFHDNLILCGTISGAMDPIGWFGIVGALITGKVAAIAVTDKDKALQEFERFNKYFKRSLFMKKHLWYPIRKQVDFIEYALHTIGIKNVEKFAAKFIYEGAHVPFSIPGFAHLGCF